MPDLEMRFFGGVRLSVAERPVALATRRTEALLVYVVCRPGPHSRGALATLLWDDRPEGRAMGNLRVLLSNLRRDLAPYLIIDRHAVEFDAGTDHRVDVVTLEREAPAALSKVGTDPHAAVASLGPLAELVRGDFLDGFSLPRGGSFDAWMLGERERLRLLAVTVIEGLVDSLLDTGAVEEAVHHARRTVRLDPLREDGHVRLIRALARGGHRKEALVEYERCRALLAEELGVEPLPETVALADAVRAGTLRPVPRPAAGDAPRSWPPPSPVAGPVIGRAKSLRELERSWRTALRGDRQVVLISGEAGIGKTTLLERFLAGLLRSATWVGTGQCIQRHGAGEPYLPITDALTRACRGDGGTSFEEHLRLWAPSWLTSLPVLTVGQRSELRRQAPGRERNLGDLAEALEQASHTRPVVLALEDLHWSDGATLEVLEFLARRRQPARLLLVGTYRADDVLRADHPLRALREELVLQNRCSELRLEGFSDGEVDDYLRALLPEAPVPPGVAAVVRRRTEGNPLFVRTLVDYARDTAVSDDPAVRDADVTRRLSKVMSAVPPALRHFIELQLDRLDDDEQRVLEVASVAGPRFDAGCVAATIDVPGIRAIEVCAGLAARRQFLRPDRDFGPSREPAADRYAFLHVLQVEVVYRRLSAERRAHLHLAIGEWLQGTLGDAPSDRAAELALHFERGRDHPQAAAWSERAAENAAARHAHRESAHHLARAIGLLDAVPHDRERDRWELRLQVALSASLMACEGFASPCGIAAIHRAAWLSDALDDRRSLLVALAGLWNNSLTIADLGHADEVAGRMLALADADPTGPAPLVAHNAAGQTALFRGGASTAAQHAEVVATRYDYALHHGLVKELGEDPGVVCHAYAGQAAWLLGFPDRAREHAGRAVALAERLGHPFGIAQALWFAALVYQLCGSAQQVRARSDALLEIHREHGTPPWDAGGMFFRGWALARLGDVSAGVELMGTGLAQWAALEVALFQPYYLAELASVLAQAGRRKGARARLAEGRRLAEASGARWYLSELWRLEGELAADTDGEDGLRRSLDAARKNGLRSLELRAALSLGRRQRSRGDRDGARQLVASVYVRFREGFDTQGLREAEAFLAGAEE